MVQKFTGWFLMVLGAMGGDSEKLWLPVLIMLIGAVLLISGKDDDTR